MSDEYEALIDAATEYLRSIGADPMVIGGTGMMQAEDGRKLNHYLTIRWTGTLPATTPGEPRETPPLETRADWYAAPSASTADLDRADHDGRQA